MPTTLAALRQLLSETPTVNRWWRCVELVEEGEQKDLREYLLKHVKASKEWNRVRVPCGDWPHYFSGFELCELRVQSLECLPEATEVYCPPGSFLMGAPKEASVPVHEKPQRKVILTRGFWSLSTPVTQEMYERITGHNPSGFRHPKRPVESVSWPDAVRFCNQLSSEDGRTPVYQVKGDEAVWLQDADGYRLPTDAEWEYMARAGCSNSVYGEDCLRHSALV